ncbi:hypothetical protein U1Q18_036390 [Sarracenia purpurea var. burkii]
MLLRFFLVVWMIMLFPEGIKPAASVFAVVVLLRFLCAAGFLGLSLVKLEATEEKVEDASELYEEEVVADIYYEVKGASEKQTEVGEPTIVSGGPPVTHEVENDKNEESTGSKPGEAVVKEVEVE